MEGWLSRWRVGEQPGDVQELDDAARPPVRQQQRCGVSALRPQVKQMHHDTVDRGPPLPEAVQLGLEASPVIPLEPVLAQRLELGQRHTPRPRVRTGRHQVCLR